LKEQKNALVAFHGDMKKALELVVGLKKWGNYNFYTFGPTVKILEGLGIQVHDISAQIDFEISLELALDPVKWVQNVEKSIGISVDLVAFNFCPPEELLSRPDITYNEQFAVTNKLVKDLAVVCNPEDYEAVSDWVMEHCPRKDVFLEYLYGKADTDITDYRKTVSAYFHTNV